MADDFNLSTCPREYQMLFYHDQAQAQLGASIFWTIPAAVIGESVDEFIGYWQVKRDRHQRGIVEVRL